MKFLAKATLGALMLAGATAVVATPASAGVSFGIGFGPAYHGQPYYGRAYCDPRSRYYDPYYCDDYDYYYGPPLYIGGYWYDRPLRSRYYSGHRQFWIHNGWRTSDRYRGGGEFRRGGGNWNGSGHGSGNWSGGGRGGGYGSGHGGGRGGGYGSGHGGGRGGGNSHGGGHGGGHR